MQLRRLNALDVRTRAAELAVARPRPKHGSHIDESRFRLKGRYSMSALPHKYRIWLDRGVALGELLQRLSRFRNLAPLRPLTTAGVTGSVSTSHASETGLSRRDMGSIDKEPA